MSVDVTKLIRKSLGVGACKKCNALQSKMLDDTNAKKIDNRCRQAINKLMGAGEPFGDIFDGLEVIDAKGDKWRLEVPHVACLKLAKPSIDVLGGGRGKDKYVVGTDLTRWQEDINSPWLFRVCDNLNEAVVTFIRIVLEDALEGRHMAMLASDGEKSFGPHQIPHLELS